MSRKKVTMQQIADAASVSRTTVSFVLNGRTEHLISAETRQRVLHSARVLGYTRETPAVGNAIAFLVRRSLDHIAQAAFLVEVLRGLSMSVEQTSYRVGLYETPDEDIVDYEDWLAERAYAGLILFNVLTAEREALARLASAGPRPVVTIHPTGVSQVTSVGIDNVLAAHDAVQHLIALGHRRIAAITYAPPSHVISQHRLMGYRQALEQAGLRYDKRLIANGHFTSESGYEAMLALLRRVAEPPTAVFVMSDVVAVGAIQAVRDMGYDVPKDMSFVGFDDIPLSQYLTPSLTTVRQPGVEIGRYAGETLLKLIDSGQRVPSTLLPADIIARGSTCKPDSQV